MLPVPYALLAEEQELCSKKELSRSSERLRKRYSQQSVRLLEEKGKEC